MLHQSVIHTYEQVNTNGWKRKLAYKIAAIRIAGIVCFFTTIACVSRVSTKNNEDIESSIN